MATKAAPQYTLTAHQTYMGLLGELIGIAVLAVIADLNEDVGKVAVAVMVGWFIIFLTINAGLIAGAFQTVGLTGPPPNTKLV